MARVSSTSMLRRRSWSHTFQARRAIGRAFHSISGMLSATTAGLALKAISRETVGNASGKRFDTAGGAGLAAGVVCAEFRLAIRNLMSSRLASAKRSSSLRSCGSSWESYSITRAAQSKLKRAVLTPV